MVRHAREGKVTMDKKKLYVTAFSFGNEPLPEPEELVWTLSFDPADTGWDTDASCEGYGLSKEVAEEIAQAYNEKYGL